MDESKLIHFSDTPWGNYTAADYTIAQWDKACLIHQHVGPPTAKGQCKLPIRVPSGAVNVNGIFAAAAALDGARGGVDASADEKATAAKELIKNYKILNHEPPPGLLHIAGVVIAHFGVQGMHWGVRKPEPGPTSVVVTGKHRISKTIKTTGGKHQPYSPDAYNAAVSKRMALKSSTDSLSTKQLQEMVNRMNLEQQYSRLETDSLMAKSGARFARKQIKEHGGEIVSTGIGVGRLVSGDPRSGVNLAIKVANAFTQHQSKPKSKKKKR